MRKSYEMDMTRGPAAAQHTDLHAAAAAVGRTPAAVQCDGYCRCRPVRRRECDGVGRLDDLAVQSAHQCLYRHFGGRERARGAVLRREKLRRRAADRADLAAHRSGRRRYPGRARHRARAAHADADENPGRGHRGRGVVHARVLYRHACDHDLQLRRGGAACGGRHAAAAVFSDGCRRDECAGRPAVRVRARHGRGRRGARDRAQPVRLRGADRAVSDRLGRACAIWIYAVCGSTRNALRRS